MAVGSIKVKIEFRCRKWQRAGLIAGAMWRAALGRDYEQWLHSEINKYIHVSDPYING